MLSIITPVFNNERFIESCIQTVLDQACSEVEHIIVDGGSTDRTVEVIKQYAENYPHIKWISEKDKGQADAMNKGIARAKGEIIGTLNVDDFYEQNVFNRILEIFKSLPEPSLLVGNCNIWDDEGNLKGVNKPAKLKLADLLVGYYVNPYPVNPSAYFYHTSLHKKIGLYKADDHYAFDLEFLLRAIQGANVKYVDETWGNYRQIEGTKTVDDFRSGQGYKRQEFYLKFYRKDLPLFQRWQVALAYEFYHKKERFRYYSQQPQDLLPKLKVKLRRILSK